MMRVFRMLALALFLAYLAVFPGSTLTVALDRIPAWGASLGGALLVLQGAAVLCWLIGVYGQRGAATGVLLLVLAWGVEYIGVTTGFPFGSYSYTALLQPQLPGAVPLAIACAWPMVALGAWQLAAGHGPFGLSTSLRAGKRRAGRWTTDDRSFLAVVSDLWSVVTAATLVLLLDLQIETVATAINPYWVWHAHGLYYGVPAANFIAWWVVGLAMAWLISKLLPANAHQLGSRASDMPLYDREVPLQRSRVSQHMTHYAVAALPAAMYLCSTLMFVVMNLARGFVLAGMIGIAVLIGIVSRLAPRLGAPLPVRPRDISETE